MVDRIDELLDDALRRSLGKNLAGILDNLVKKKDFTQSKRGNASD